MPHHRAQAQGDPNYLAPGRRIMNDGPSRGNEFPSARLARRLDQICDRFEAAWKAGRRPRLERYLGKLPSAAQAELLRELLILELEYRDQKGEKPLRQEYAVRFPEHAELIETVFSEARQNTPATPYLLPRWTMSRLANQVRRLALPADEGKRDRPGHFSALAHLLGLAAAEDGAPQVAPVASSPFELPTKLLEAGRAASSVPREAGKETPPLMVLGDYELLDPLGMGGMGVVYRARQRSAHRIVALKVIRSDRLEQLSPVERQEWFERFRREGQIAACLNHDNLVSVYEVGQVDGQHFYSMRLVEGQTLAEILRQGPLSAHRTVIYLEQVSRALHALHLRGIVHRDLKPRNILVDTNDRPFVTDFGLAKWSEYTQGVTQLEACVGTPEYMAPEQARNPASVREASDIYSLGATLYELLTGRPPFHAADPIETRRQVLDEEPLSPRRLNPAVHRDLELICLKCLEKEPNKRYASALQVADELRRYRNSEPLRHTRPVGKAEHLWRWCRRKPFQAAAAGLAAVVLMAVTALTISLAFVVQLRGEKEHTQTALKEAETHRREANRWLSRLRTLSALEQGQTLCEKGDVPRGLLWLARSLELDPASPPDLNGLIRTNLACWSRLLSPLRALLPHAEEVAAVAFGRDGRTFLTATRHQVQLWEAATCKSMGAPFDVRGYVLAAALSPDGKMFLTGSADNTARLWEADTGRVISLPHNGTVTAVAFSPDGKIVLTGSSDKTAQFWDAVSGQPFGKPLPHKGPVLAVAFSPDGKTVWTGSTRWDWKALPVLGASAMGLLGSPMPGASLVAASALMPGTTPLRWDIVTGLPVVQPLPDLASVSTLAISADGKAFLTVDGSTVQIWHAATGKSIGKPFRMEGAGTAGGFSPDGKLVLTASKDKTAQLWQVSSGKPVGPRLHHQDIITSVGFSPDGRFILSGSEDKTARLWEVASTESHRLSLAHPSTIQAAAFSFNGKMVVTGSEEGDIRIWDVATGKLRGPGLKHQKLVKAVAFSPDGKTLLTGSWDATARLWEVATGRLLHLLPHRKQVWAVAFSPDGKTALTGSLDGTAQLWDAATGQPIGLPLHHRRGAGVYSVAFSSDGKRIVTGGGDDTAQVWDAAAQQPMSPPLQHKDEVWRAIFSSDGRFVLTGSLDGTAQVWDALTGDRLGPSLPHQGKVWAVAFSSDDSLILTGSDDQGGTARLWETVTGQLRGDPLQHQGIVRSVAFSPDARLVLTGSEDKTARFWDAATGRRCGPPLQHEHLISSAIFSPDGKTVLTVGLKAARLWKVPVPVEGTVERIVLWTNVITGMKLDSSGAVHLLDSYEWHQDRQLVAERGGPLVP
jgi:WD40 repeat protein/predicted Ser/Thr protein kinase